TMPNACGGVTRKPLTVLLDARLHEFIVELRARTVHDDRRQADALQESQRRREFGQVIAQYRAADLHDGEPLRVLLRKALQVLLDLPGAAHCRQQADDGVAYFAHADCILTRGPPEASPGKTGWPYPVPSPWLPG